MSIIIDIKRGVELKPRKKRGLLVPAIIALEAFLSFFLYLSIAGKIFAPPPVRSAAGIPELISYQGRLTDTSGNPLGGTGAVYCFRYSIYDTLSGSNKVWPAGTPTNSTTTVIDGIFTDQVGRMDSLSPQDFYSTSTLYLQVSVNTVTSTCSGSWEDLSPRQQIVSSAWSQMAQGVYGDALRTPSATRVQIGTGAGQATSSMTLLSLDVANVAESFGGSCSNNGSVWYNSAMTRALVCENGTIMPISNSSTTIAGIGVNSSVVSGGTVVFSNSNNVSFGLNGSTITATATFAAGGGTTQSYWPTYPIALGSATNNTGTTGATGDSTQISDIFHVGPLWLQDAVSFSRVNLLVSNITVAGTGSGSVARNIGIYTLNQNTAFSLLSSFLFRHEVSQNSVTAQSHRFYWGLDSNANSSSSGGNISANYVGVRALPISTGNTSLSAGQYYLVYGQYNITAGVNAFSGYNNMYISESATTAGQLGSAVTLPFVSKWLGVFSSTTNTNVITGQFMPASIHTSAISNTGGLSRQLWPFINFVGS